jgi:hypothetical protein
MVTIRSRIAKSLRRAAVSASDAAQRPQVVLAQGPVAGDLHQLRLDRRSRLQRVVDQEHEVAPRLELAHHQLPQDQLAAARVPHRGVHQQVVRRQVRGRDVDQLGVGVRARDVRGERRGLADAVLAEDLPGLAQVDHRVDERLQGRGPGRGGAPGPGAPAAALARQPAVLAEAGAVVLLLRRQGGLAGAVLAQRSPVRTV